MKRLFNDKHRVLGLTIAYYRKIKGYTQAELAEQAGISRTHLSNIEASNMDVGVSLDTVFMIADALEVPICTLFEKC
ncbi:XRE family transcriptional regulator [Lactonifactor longoviformis]|uniref:Helix-turn-helix n=1 Tax=Lactonifactor longoviformis DSM 17459 TaxID=1122155 RepID=A0A1M5D6Z1_9CLOT|nr:MULTISPECIES: helix-turn-helix transcriptional regulator [Lactonifactor]MSA01065.1 helix-turn-helix domain-containing protein [Lactonifactor sp. BIOML-A5]MSA10290.1 helix-turn-helix domain-containing protein [Lactonifactor sp. BIOML-A4]MSA13100.1 helix-turn-helix domain-containing protein [Lactonifactor sp. BIOML-A3]MSA19262.1 helix-turn-helix domain-containing protein [Lactonifactor sp. BIOML-A2]MSA38339.1 helix-turn-helix domain-containing protein [Lactonifactor sp. BIOML-A1]